MAKILIPIPRKDFDPTETAIPWKIFKSAGHEVYFATVDGTEAKADSRMLDGLGLGPFQSLKANQAALTAYSEMQKDPHFLAPQKWSECLGESFQGLVLPGGHAAGMREYLESEILQTLVSQFFQAGYPVGAICHGVVLASRSLSTVTGRSVLFGKKTTALPQWMELSAWAMTKLWLGNYYRTYPQTVQDEIISKLKDSKDFILGPLSLRRDSLENLNAGFTVKDGNFLSARWPGDAHRFATEFLGMI